MEALSGFFSILSYKCSYLVTLSVCFLRGKAVPKVENKGGKSKVTPVERVQSAPIKKENGAFKNDGNINNTYGTDAYFVKPIAVCNSNFKPRKRVKENFPCFIKPKAKIGPRENWFFFVFVYFRDGRIFRAPFVLEPPSLPDDQEKQTVNRRLPKARNEPRPDPRIRADKLL